METDQLQKRIQWIEDERRKEKDVLARLENRVVSLEGSLAAANQQVKDLSGELNRLAAIITRMDQYDETLFKLRIESKRMVEELDKEFKKREEETGKVRQVELRAIDATLDELRNGFDPLPKMEKGILSCIEDNNRLKRTLDELRERVEGIRRDEENYTRTYRLLEDGRRQDSKRLVDLQGEVTALRKRVEDLRGQFEVTNTAMRKTDARLSELAVVETERRDAMANFLDKQALTQVERDRIWKDWQTRFATIEKQAADVEAQLLTLDATQREARRSQAVLEELNQRVERRISEITEIQRLAEDRFRQEWVTFKADDQKRWTNYTLTQEEQRSEMLRQFEKITAQTTQLEDGLQEVQDMVEQANEQTEKRLQSLLAMVHDWVSTYERTVGSSR